MGELLMLPEEISLAGVLKLFWNSMPHVLPRASWEVSKAPGLVSVAAVLLQNMSNPGVLTVLLEELHPLELFAGACLRPGLLLHVFLLHCAGAFYSLGWRDWAHAVYAVWESRACLQIHVPKQSRLVSLFMCIASDWLTVLEGTV